MLKVLSSEVSAMLLNSQGKQLFVPICSVFILSHHEQFIFTCNLILFILQLEILSRSRGGFAVAALCTIGKCAASLPATELCLERNA